jgi:hypothetical protein
MGRWVISRAVLASALVLLVGLAVTPVASVAQDATPAMQMQMGEGHPVHIHDGTCATLGGIAFPLNNLTHEGTMSTPMAGMAATPVVGAGEEVESQSSTTIDATLDDLLAESYAINAHESVQKIEVYIACGDITGAPENGTLQIELGEQNASGVHGWAWLRDSGNGKTTVDVVLVGMHCMMGTPEAMATP